MNLILSNQKILFNRYKWLCYHLLFKRRLMCCFVYSFDIAFTPYTNYSLMSSTTTCHFTDASQEIVTTMVSISNSLPTRRINTAMMAGLDEDEDGGRLSQSLSPCSSSWNMSLRKLSDSLTEICHSPTTTHNLPRSDFPPTDPLRSPPKLIKALSHDETYSRASPPTADTCGDIATRACPEEISGALQAIATSATATPGDVSAVNGVLRRKDGRRFRKVRVRHEQSKRRLHEQLAVICGKVSRSTTASHDTLAVALGERRAAAVAAVADRKRPMIRSESVKMAYRCRVVVGARDVENLAVLLDTAVGRLTVTALDDGRETVLHVADMPADKLLIEQLMCVLDGDVLDVKQHRKRYLQLSYDDDGIGFLPVMQQGDHTWSMAMRMRGTYSDGAGVQVRTVDDQLEVMGGGRLRGHMRMELPYNVETRTVNGILTEDDQLLLEARLGSGRDRCYSC